MTGSLSKSRAILVGMIVIIAILACSWGCYQLAIRENVFSNGYQLMVGFPDVSRVHEGTPVTVRGVNAGQVVRIEYPETDDPEGESLVLVHFELKEAFRGRIHDDATVSIQSTDLLGGSVVAIDPGSPKAGPLRSDQLVHRNQPSMEETAARLASVAERADSLLTEIQESDGTIAKLLRDDTLYRELEAITSESRELVTYSKVMVERFDQKLDGVDQLVRSSQETADTLKQDAEAIQKLPIIRGYVEDPTAVMMRPDAKRERQIFTTEDIFEPGTAVLTSRGRELIQHAANWLRDPGNKVSGSEIAVIAFADPKNKDLTPAYAKTLTQKQCEAVKAVLETHKAHKLNWLTWRTITPKGFGFSSPPVNEKETFSPNNVQILLFVPR